MMAILNTFINTVCIIPIRNPYLGVDDSVW